LPEKIRPYEIFAEAYDEIMCSVDYEAWADYVEALLAKFNSRPHSLVDLACGTGSSTLPFARRGYKTTGVDLSRSMLKKARQKLESENLPAEFIEQDLRHLSLPEKYDLAVLFQDGLNYLIDENDLAKALKQVHAVLHPSSLFIFDLTRPGLRPDNQESTSCKIELEKLTLDINSHYCHETDLWSAEMIVSQQTENGIFKRSREEHQEKDHHPKLIVDLLEKNGYKTLAIYPSFKLEPVEGNEAKLTFIAKKFPLHPGVAL